MSMLQNSSTAMVGNKALKSKPCKIHWTQMRIQGKSHFTNKSVATILANI